MRSALGTFLLLATSTLLSQTPTPPSPAAQADATALAKETQNPVGDIVSVPFQFNFNSGGAYQRRAHLSAKALNRSQQTIQAKTPAP
jgi:hypothetical protein